MWSGLPDARTRHLARPLASASGEPAPAKSGWSIASWLLAPGSFHSRLADAGADVVAAPLGAHPDVVAAVVARYRTALHAAAV